MQWFEVLLSIPEILKDPIVNRLFELGAQGVTEEDQKGTTAAVVKAFFETVARSTVEKELPLFLNSLSEMHPKLPAVTVKIKEVVNENWGDRYKEFYHAQKLSRYFFLKPAWEIDAVVPEEMIPIVMEPGQAFGTGLHATTRLCLCCLEQLLRYFPEQQKARVMDVGTGSGILAIAAHKLGFKNIDAIDNDPVAVEAALENLVLNDTPSIVVSGVPLENFKGPYDMVIANILLETHLQLRHEYRRLLKVGGQLLLSGLLGFQLNETRAAMTEVGFVEEFSDCLQEWAAIVFTAKAK